MHAKNPLFFKLINLIVTYVYSNIYFLGIHNIRLAVSLRDGRVCPRGRSFPLYVSTILKPPPGLSEKFSPPLTIAVIYRCRLSVVWLPGFPRLVVSLLGRPSNSVSSAVPPIPPTDRVGLPCVSDQQAWVRS